MEREQTSKMKALLAEFKKLKGELFGNNTFVVLDDKDPRVSRYNQLLQFFFPCYRTKGFVSPM